MNIDFAQVLPYLPVLLKAALMTIFLAVVTQVCGTVFGLVLALARDARLKALNVAAFVYIWVFRGTPVLLHLFFVYYAAPLFGLRLDALPAAIIALSMSSAAYNAEIIRAGIRAVPRGQTEASQALGMTWPLILRFVVLPQAMRIVLPPYVGNFISHTKNTSLASVITVPELMLSAQTIYSSTYRAVEVLTLTGLIYLTITTVLTLAQLRLERANTARTGSTPRRKRPRASRGPLGQNAR
ncbi:polar amino acid transport system permease protein/cystine transport system permease protein [Paraburkholderia caballeronis]|uniref:amino acid ABC transporter permease n=1 Tax=Paraburkholderia caballeronis TaxID=416943 RepID=UPI0010655A3A|nr:amino acid ABC transporter permease [Paraburkholderia caballeronis]TDV35570.1 polar amino acid transport system permease protein/cystine transport system permease protein [Paraburkholderia caballeronis]